jgi:hypothetical protein
MKSKFKYILLICVLSFFTECRKKYPENTMKLFQKPRKLELMRGFITSYKVNGIDSLDALNYYFKLSPTNPFKIQNCEVVSDDEHERNRVILSNQLLQFRYEWNADYNFIFLFHQNDTSVIKKNILIINGNNWKIQKLVKAKKTGNHQLKITSEFNGNKYEIQFN